MEIQLASLVCMMILDHRDIIMSNGLIIMEHLQLATNTLLTVLSLLTITKIFMLYKGVTNHKTQLSQDTHI